MKNNGFKFIAALLVLLILFVISVLFGSVSIPVKEGLSILMGYTSDTSTFYHIIWDFRIPKTLTAILAGTALSLSGLHMQTLFRNPLADPFVLGISSGASLFVALLMMGGALTGVSVMAMHGWLESVGTAVSAIAGSSVMLLLILLISQRIHQHSTLLIIGLMMGYFVSSIVSLLVFYSSAENLQSYMLWTLGSFSGVTSQQLYLMLFLVSIGALFSMVLAKQLNAMQLGERVASSLGLSYAKTRNHILFTTAILSGTVTAFCGPIGFLGVAVPHISRGFFRTSDHRLLIPATAICGAILALVSEILTNFPGSSQTLPLNSITALIGAPVMIWIAVQSQRRKQDA